MKFHPICRPGGFSGIGSDSPHPLAHSRRVIPNGDGLRFVVALWTGLTVSGAEPRQISFRSDIAPILLNRCVTCHNEEKPKGGYRLDTFDHLRKAGESGQPALTPSSASRSELYLRVVATAEEDRMPQKGDALSPSETALIRRWIDEGGAYDGDRPGQSLVEIADNAFPRRAPARYAFPIPIAAVAFADTNTLLTAGTHELLAWSTTGELVERREGLPERTQALAVSDGGRRVYFAGGSPGQRGLAGVLERGSTLPPSLWVRAPEVFMALALSPDGRRIAVAGGERVIRVLDTRDGSQLLGLVGHSDWVLDLAFSPDSQQLATASRDGTARVFHLADGRLISAFRGHEAPVVAVRWAPSGKQVFTAGRDRRLRRWNPDTGGDPKVFPEFPAEVTRLTIVGEMVLAACADGRVRGFPPSEAMMEWRLGDERWIAIAGGPGAGAAVVGSNRGEIRLWNPRAESTLPNRGFTALPPATAPNAVTP